MLIFDAHLDLAMNALEWNRDLTRPIAALREREAHLTDKPDRGRGTVCLPEMRRGLVGICVATLIARIEHNAYSPVFGWASPAQAWAQTQGQLAWYRAMEEAGHMTPLRNLPDLDRHLALWSPGPGPASTATASPTPSAPATPAAEPPIGFVLSLEGADSLRSPGHLEAAWTQGLRAIGPAHYGPGVYANGTAAQGRFPARGRDLLREMDRLGFILDVTHLCDDCFWEALDLYQGPVWASHSNCRALVPNDRQFSDDQLRALFQRGAVIGVALDAWMLVPGWIRGTTTPASARLHLHHLADHIDHICQLAGNAHHVGIGSDLDGAFGREQTPQDLDTIADLQRLPDLLAARGFPGEAIEGIASGNFLNLLRRAWSHPA